MSAPNAAERFGATTTLHGTRFLVPSSVALAWDSPTPVEVRALSAMLNGLLSGNATRSPGLIPPEITVRFSCGTATDSPNPLPPQPTVVDIESTASAHPVMMRMLANIFVKQAMPISRLF